MQANGQTFGKTTGLFVTSGGYAILLQDTTTASLTPATADAIVATARIMLSRLP
jgi:hypothetical protein